MGSWFDRPDYFRPNHSPGRTHPLTHARAHADSPPVTRAHAHCRTPTHAHPHADSSFSDPLFWVVLSLELVFKVLRDSGLLLRLKSWLEDTKKAKHATSALKVLDLTVDVLSCGSEMVGKVQGGRGGADGKYGVRHRDGDGGEGGEGGEDGEDGEDGLRARSATTAAMAMDDPLERERAEEEARHHISELGGLSAVINAVALLCVLSFEYLVVDVAQVRVPALLFVGAALMSHDPNRP